MTRTFPFHKSQVTKQVTSHKKKYNYERKTFCPQNGRSIYKS